MITSYDYINLGPTPAGESCAQLGSDDYRNQAKKEMTAYMNQLYRMYPEVANTSGMKFKIMWFDHDFGSYGEVVIAYLAEEELVDKAIEIEHNIPENWDEESLIELGVK